VSFSVGFCRDWKFLGFHWFVSSGGSARLGNGLLTTLPRWSVRVPLRFVGSLFALLPLRWMLRFRRTPAGHCTRCGYDLRATPDRFPECGAVPAPT
jgi:hypothetical protein